MSKSRPLYALYFNGLGEGKTRKREQLAMSYLAKQGIQVEHISIDWRSSESFEKLLERLSEITRTRLKQHGKLLIIGSSAGGSLALNVFKKVDNKNLSVVTLCSRLHNANLAWWDWRSMERMAYIGTPKASQSFVDSVAYCTNETIPRLTRTDKRRITIVQQLVDDVVPKRTMEIEDAKTYKVLAVGHGWGIAEGARQLPQILFKRKVALHPLLKLVFWGILVFSTYHLIRDLLQTFNLDSAFTDIGHRSHQWCGQYCDVVTIPFDVVGILVAATVLKKNRLGMRGAALLATLPLWAIFTLLP
jgi:hypothetical protein